MRITKAGWWRSEKEDWELVVVFRVEAEWYWQRVAFDHQTPQGMIIGPYPSSDEAYKGAME